MSFTLPKPQRRHNVFTAKDAIFPVPISTWTGLPPNNGRWYYYVAYLIDGSILVKHSGDVEQLYRMGFFGKGTLSRHHPKYDHMAPTINWPDEHGNQRTLKVISRRKYIQRASWARLELSADGKETQLPLPKKGQRVVRGQGRVKDADVKTAPSPGERLPSDDEHVTDADGRDVTAKMSPEPKAKRLRLDGDDGGGGCDGSETMVVHQSDAALGEGDRSLEPAGDQRDPWSVTTERESAEFWTAAEGCQSGTPDASRPEAINTPGVERRDCAIEDSHCSMTAHDDNSQAADCSSEPSATNADVTSGQRDVIGRNANGQSAVMESAEVRSSSSDDDDDRTVSSSSSSRPEAGLANYRLLDERCMTDDVDGDLLVVSDTDDSDVDVAMDTRLSWQPVVKRDPFEVKEFLQLSMEEAFFLSYALGCLILYDTNKVALSLEEMWQTFCKKDDRFLARYIAYHNFRSKGWVPKSGLKYGTDFVIYKEGPAFYHSTYSVIVIQVPSDSLVGRHEGMARTNSWTALSALNRVTEQVSKSLMLCYVIEPAALTAEEMLSPTVISRFTVQEVVVCRMMSKQERENAEYMMIP